MDEVPDSSDLASLQRQIIEQESMKKDLHQKLSHIENQHNQYLQLQHEHDKLECDNQ